MFGDNYAEYKLNQNHITELIGVPKAAYDFWLTNQPQWDAIGMTKETIVLVEAKAHIKELNSNLSATSEGSKELIYNTMRNVFEKQYSDGDFENWIKKYYQLGNRLTFLQVLNDLVNKSGRQVKLVLLNIVNDPTYIPTTEKEWDDSYNDVIIVNFNV